MSDTKHNRNVLNNLLLGDVGGLCHPLHPAIVHFPLAFFMLAFSIDSLGLVYPKTVQNYLPPPLSVVSLFESGRWMHILGIATSLPAVVTGAAEFFSMNAKSRAITTVYLHMAANTIVCTPHSHRNQGV